VLRFDRGNPQHAHVCGECADCTWLGAYERYDLYVCRSESRGVVLIVRYGNRTHDYAQLSLTHFKGNTAELTAPFDVAYARAVAAGKVG
jgi:hypothetical protein